MSNAPWPLSNWALSDWWQKTAELLPPGLAWPRDPASNIGKIVNVIATERQSRHADKLLLLNTESVPEQSVDLLPDWEQALGLPDPCRAAPGTLAQRWAAIADVFFAEHDPTPANMIAWAAAAGWNITIREQTDFVAGISVAGDPVGESDSAWVVTVLDQAIVYFQAGRNQAGDVLSTYPDLTTLECVLRRAAPAQTQVYFVVP